MYIDLDIEWGIPASAFVLSRVLMTRRLFTINNEDLTLSRPSELDTDTSRLCSHTLQSPARGSMPSLPRSETSAWVEVGGSRAEEYSVTNSEAQAASCHIEAVQNQEFVVRGVSQTSGVMWKLIVDGEEQVSHCAGSFRDSADV